jgi:DnaJ-class molecular chaperone
VDVPKKLTCEQKQILEQLAKTMPNQPDVAAASEEKPFFEKVKDIFG